MLSSPAGACAHGTATAAGCSRTPRISRGGEFSFTEPYFLGTRVSAGFDVYVKQQSRSDYNPVDSTTAGGTLRMGLPLREDLTLGLDPDFEEAEA